MKLIALLFTLLFSYGCDSRNETGVNIPDDAPIKKEIAGGVKDVINKRAPKWVIDYSGDVKGSIQGGIMTAITVSSFTKIGGTAMTKDMKGKAPETFMLTILNISTPPTATMALTLADGTKCKDAKASTVNITNQESKTFKAEAAGVLVCGDKKISYQAKMNKNP